MKTFDFSKATEQFTENLVSGLLPFLARQALDLNALIQRRIVGTGMNADDVQLGEYTSEGYIKKREKAGRQVEYVDLTFTRGGAGMFGSTGLIAQEYSNGRGRATIGGKDEFAQNKIDWNSERYKDILRASEKEKKIVEQGFELFIDDLIKQSGL